MAHVQHNAPPPPPARDPGPRPGMTPLRAYIVSAIAVTAAVAVPVTDSQYQWERPAVAVTVYVLGALPVLLRTHVGPRLRDWLLRQPRS
ncbi:hypothetical protein ACN24M_00615 [Streptomyces microflavus]|uniref:hypothetical protein n=1 Tax=Streptomyces microflavus TaxID=1919 RepID=UPI003B20FD51